MYDEANENPSLSTWAMLLGVGAGGWYVYRRQQRAKLADLLRALPDIGGRADEIAAEEITYFSTKTADEAYKELVGSSVGISARLLSYLPEGTQESVRQSAEAIQAAASEISSEVRGGANVAQDTAASWSEWLPWNGPEGLAGPGGDLGGPDYLNKE